MIQFSVTEDAPMHAPPPASSTFFVRVFERVPCPQVLEQSPIVHSFHSQSALEFHGNLIIEYDLILNVALL